MTRYLVCKFGKSTLTNLVKESFGVDFPNIFNKRQIDYIYRYLKDIHAASVLLEFDYLDKDYLEDYSRYYVKCFNNSGHKTARLHFFSEEVFHSHVDKALLNDKESLERIKKSYLGFMVIKPLQRTFIGKTCLKKYEKLLSESNRVCLDREYSVDLFGIPLTINSVAFQEQDKIVSACATTAIWSSLHAMKCKSVRNIPACSEITTNAINHIDGSTNMFPNKELSNKQILRALDFEGLKHHVLNVNGYTSESFFNTVRFHINSGIPLILGADVYAINDGVKLSRLAGHAVTIVGYKNEPDDQALYVHDDRLGPYARAKMILPNDNLLKAAEISGNQNILPFGLILQIKDENSKWADPHEILIPYTLIAATHQKVRLSSDFAVNTCETIKEEFEHLLKMAKDEVGLSCEVYEASKNSLSFDVILKEISEIRREIIQNSPDYEDSLPDKKKIAFLTKSYARFHWVANFSFKDKPAFKVLFDATDIPQGNAVAGVYEEENGKYVLPYFESLFLTYTPDEEKSDRVLYGSFIKALKITSEGDRASFLDEKYGELRAPMYIKDSLELDEGMMRENPTTQIIHEASQKSLMELLGLTSSSENTLPNIIWAISHDGALIIGKECPGEGGHPCITGFKPARISGELIKDGNAWHVNTKSGRYSGTYNNANCLLDNAIDLFKSKFYKSGETFTAVYNSSLAD